MTASRQILFGGRTAYIDVHRSARDLLRSTAQVFCAAGIDPASLTLRVA